MLYICYMSVNYQMSFTWLVRPSKGDDFSFAAPQLLNLHPWISWRLAGLGVNVNVLNNGICLYGLHDFNWKVFVWVYDDLIRFNGFSYVLFYWFNRNLFDFLLISWDLSMVISWELKDIFVFIWGFSNKWLMFFDTDFIACLKLRLTVIRFAYSDWMGCRSEFMGLYNDLMGYHVSTWHQ